ncbi:CARDB domain-containing protein [Chloroflexota bacterium]
MNKILAIIVVSLVLSLGAVSCAPVLAQVAEVAAVAAVPEVLVTNLSVTPAQIQSGGKVTITIDVTNSGDGERAYHVGLDINDKRYTASDVVIPAGSTESVTYSAIISEAGDYTATSDDLSQTFNVIAGEPQQVDKSEYDSILKEIQLLKAEASSYRIAADELTDPIEKSRLIRQSDNLEELAMELYSIYMDALYKNHVDPTPLWGKAVS